MNFSLLNTKVKTNGRNSRECSHQKKMTSIWIMAEWTTALYEAISQPFAAKHCQLLRAKWNGSKSNKFSNYSLFSYSISNRIRRSLCWSFCRTTCAKGLSANAASIRSVFENLYAKFHLNSSLENWFHACLKVFQSWLASFHNSSAIAGL